MVEETFHSRNGRREHAVVGLTCRGYKNADALPFPVGVERRQVKDILSRPQNLYSVDKRLCLRAYAHAVDWRGKHDDIG